MPNKKSTQNPLSSNEDTSEDQSIEPIEDNFELLNQVKNLKDKLAKRGGASASEVVKNFKKDFENPVVANNNLESKTRIDQTNKNKFFYIILTLIILAIVVTIFIIFRK